MKLNNSLFCFVLSVHETKTSSCIQVVEKHPSTRVNVHFLDQLKLLEVPPPSPLFLSGGSTLGFKSCGLGGLGLDKLSLEGDG